MPTRGIRALLRRTAPGKLVRSRRGTAYRRLGSSGRPVGARLRGVARLIGETLWSSGELPRGPAGAAAARGPAWRGPGGGMRRGRAVDGQISKLVRAGPKARKLTRPLKLTSMFFAALDRHGLEPVDAQRVVVDAQRGLGTAIDVVCQRGDEIVLVELKCGYDGDRSAPAVSPRGSCRMRHPLQKAVDSALHRHLAQLAATKQMFDAEENTSKLLSEKGIERVVGALLYISDEGSELHELPKWWERRGDLILQAIT